MKIEIDKVGDFKLICPVCGNEGVARMAELKFGFGDVKSKIGIVSLDRIHVIEYTFKCKKCGTESNGKLRLPGLCARVGDKMVYDNAH